MVERCISCGNDTPYDVSTHIDLRENYIEGAGQLCVNCAALNKMFPESPNMDHLKHIAVSVHTVKSTPNDAELGAKVRELYWTSL